MQSYQRTAWSTQDTLSRPGVEMLPAVLQNSELIISSSSSSCGKQHSNIFLLEGKRPTIISREMSALCSAWLLLTLNLLNTKSRWWQGTGSEHMNTAVKSHPRWQRDPYFQTFVAKCFSAVRWWDIYSVSWQHDFKPSSHTEASRLESTLDPL